jgi:hypothetical protein
VFRLACTVQPKARPAGDAATAGSGLTGTPARPKNAPDGDADSAGVPDYQVRRLPHLDLALGTRHVQAAAAGLRRATSFAHQHLLSDPFAAA